MLDPTFKVSLQGLAITSYWRGIKLSLGSEDGNQCFKPKSSGNELVKNKSHIKQNPSKSSQFLKHVNHNGRLF